jgi:transposase
MSEEIKESTVVIVEPKSVRCPYCGSTLDGLFGDPRGYEIYCDECNRVFKVSQNAVFKVF